MSSEVPEEDDFSRDFVDPEVDMKLPKPLNYAPWHKPRKQYVRKEQWLRHTSGLLGVLKTGQHFNGGVPFKYMTLPGPDLLDIMLVKDICEDNGVKLHYTGFCSSTDDEETRLRMNVSQFSYDFSDSIAEDSVIASSKLEDVVVDGSDAHTALRRGGPFDVINIDACKPLLRHGNNVTGRLIDAIRKIVEYQVANRSTPWVILLTTPMQSADISDESKVNICNHIERNSQTNEEFAQALAAHLADGEGLEDFLLRVSSVDGLDFVRIITLGLSKWLIHLAEQASYRVKKMNGFCYSMFRQEPYEPNMVSICYLFEPMPATIQDATGLTANPVVADNQTPPKNLHVRALEKSYQIENVDTLMASRPDTYEAMITESMESLRSVGYPVDHPENGYRRWLEGEPSHELVRRGVDD